MRSEFQLRDWLLKHAHRSPRYVLVAGVCALIYNVIMIGLDRLGVHYALSQAASAVVLLPIGYLLQGHLTFGSGRGWRDFVRYSAALITNYPVALVILWLLCDLLKLGMIWASPISTIVLFIWNYATSSWAFSTRKSGRGRIAGG
jgi:putative flippase GtrA